MIKNDQIDYESYAKEMRGALSAEEMILPDNSINHQYFHAKKGFYWSNNNELQLIDGLRKYSLNFNEISKKIFKGNKS